MMKKKHTRAVFLVLTMLFNATTVNAGASGESIGSLSHIHSVRAFGNQIILGTHEGLFEYLDEKTVKRISPERFDVMGLAVSEKGFFASGHPGKGSKLPEPVGLLLTTDQGATWKKVSLTGKVDFHTLETVGDEIYGADSGSGELMYSNNAGKSWSKRGKNTFQDIAPNPKRKGSVLAIKDGQLFTSADSLKSFKKIEAPISIDAIDWLGSNLLAISGKNLYRSKDSGVTWKKLTTMSAQLGSLTQSSQLIAVVMNGAIYSSTNDGKSFKKFTRN
jgi:photosystem II stability/assembly factor-like uncharacterized protein